MAKAGKDVHPSPRTLSCQHWKSQASYVYFGAYTSTRKCLWRRWCISLSLLAPFVYLRNMTPVGNLCHCESQDGQLGCLSLCDVFGIDVPGKLFFSQCVDTTDCNRFSTVGGWKGQKLFRWHLCKLLELFFCVFVSPLYLRQILLHVDVFLLSCFRTRTPRFKKLFRARL